MNQQIDKFIKNDSWFNLEFNESTTFLMTFIASLFEILKIFASTNKWMILIGLNHVQIFTNDEQSYLLTKNDYILNKCETKMKKFWMIACLLNWPKKYAILYIFFFS